MSDMAKTFQHNSQLEQLHADDRQEVQICWYGERIGSADMTADGLAWKGYASDEMATLFGDALPARHSDNMPQFLVNLGPEHDVFGKMGLSDKADYLSTGLRFPSNITISKNAPYDLPVGYDAIQTDFDQHIDEQRVFTGQYLSRPPASFSEDVLTEELAAMWSNRYAPRYSGQESKIPVTLDTDGNIKEAVTESFTHFLKLPTEGLKDGWGVNEWMCMQLCEASGLPTAKHALIQLSEDLPPAYIVERFDIDSQDNPAKERKLMQDFCTLAGMRPLKGLEASRKEGIAAGTIEQVSKILREHSSDIEKDSENLFKRSLVSYAVGDCDMHRKNISMMFQYDPESHEITSATMSPAYDITSEIHEEESRLTMTLPMNAKGSKLKKKDFIACADKMGIPADRAEDIMRETFTSIAEKAVEIANNLPDIVTDNIMCNYTAHRIATIAVQRAQKMDYATPEWQATERVKIPPSRYQDNPAPIQASMGAFKV